MTSLLAPSWTGFDLPGRPLAYETILGYARACWPGGTQAELRLLSLQMAVMTALDDVFDTIAADAWLAPHTPQVLIPWHRGCDARTSPDGCAAIRDALTELDVEMDHLAPGGQSRRDALRAWWRQCAERQIAAFRQEALWRASAAVPDGATYLATAEQSIGVMWMASSLVALQEQVLPPAAGSVLESTIYAVARTTRLANDLHEPERERAEGKVQWWSLRAGELMRGGRPAPEAEHRAWRELRALVLKEAARARVLLNAPALRPAWKGAERLREGLHGLLATGLAVYTPDLASASVV